jgi:hypothetical protein
VNYTTRDLLKYWGDRKPSDLVLLLDGELLEGFCVVGGRCCFVVYCVFPPLYS